MGEEKSEAQKAQETEVKRIMAERGYISKTSANPKKRQNNRTPKPKSNHTKALLIVFIAAITISGGSIAFANAINNKDVSVDSISLQDQNDSIEYYTNLTGFNTCLSAIDQSEINTNDEDFWDKLKTRYEQTIVCYESYPSVADQSEKTELEANLQEINDNIANNIAADASYQEKMAQIDAKFQNAIAANQAKYEQATAATDAKTAERARQRAEQEAQNKAVAQQQAAQQQAEQQAKQQAEQQAAQEKATRCAPYANKTKEELADADENVIYAKNTYDRASSTYNKAYNDYANTVKATTNASLRNSKKAKMEEAKNAMQTANTSYNRIRNNKISYYSQILNSCK